jgi:hypothetical protein
MTVFLGLSPPESFLGFVLHAVTPAISEAASNAGISLFLSIVILPQDFAFYLNNRYGFENVAVAFVFCSRVYKSCKNTASSTAIAASTTAFSALKPAKVRQKGRL